MEPVRISVLPPPLDSATLPEPLSTIVPAYVLVAFCGTTVSVEVPETALVVMTPALEPVRLPTEIE